MGQGLHGSATTTAAMYAVHAAGGGLGLSGLRVALASVQAVHRPAGTVLDLRHPRRVMTVDRHAIGRHLTPAVEAGVAQSSEP